MLFFAACDDDEPENDPPEPGEIDTELFTHGVASGDVREDSVVLWTRADGATSLTAEVATDESFSGDVIEADGETSKERDFTVKVNVAGLEPDSRYYYRFRDGSSLSPTGTFVTAPPASASAPLRFVFSGDSDGSRREDGSPPYNEFEVLDTARADDPAFFLYFGDTIYADRDPNPAEDLDGYRAKYRENREYRALADILAATSTYNMWDDHEVVNDFAGTTVDPELFAAGLQAFREYWPIDDSTNDPETLYRTFRWGADAAMIMLDGRSFRDAPATNACRYDDGGEPDPIPAAALPGAPDALRVLREFVDLPPELPEDCAEVMNDPDATMLGAEQKEYLLDWLATTDATWKIVVNPVAIQSLLISPYDRWEGYAPERAEILEFIRDEGIDNVVFLTTDFHANIFGPVSMDPFEDNEPIAYEAVTGPIATNPLKADVEEIVGDSAAGGVEGFMEEVLQVDCLEMDSYAYTLVEIDEGFMTLTAKDDEGAELCSNELEAVR
jgi:alkaline phosphatase D